MTEKRRRTFGNNKRMAMKKDVKGTTGSTKELWTCKKCDAEFSFSKDLKKHKREIHNKNTIELSQYRYMYKKINDTYVCNTCDSEFPSEIDAETHVQTHEETYDCTVCSGKFRSAYQYSVHMHDHSEEDAFRCPMCEFKTNRKTAILKHINGKHLNRFSYNCDGCGKGFNDVVKFKEHKNVHTGQKPFSCIVCSKEFLFSDYLLAHQKRNHRPTVDGTLMAHQCHVCKKMFSKSTSLEKHLVIHQTNLPHEKKHLCDICGKGYARKHKLTDHYRVHTGVKPYTCSYCAKSFTKKYYLVLHERIHNGEKPYSCQYCGKSFNQGAPLRIHIRGHTGDRPYICHLCQNGYISKGALSTHLNTCTG